MPAHLSIPCGRHRDDVFVEPRHVLDQTLVGDVFPDNASAFFGRRECAVPGQESLTIAGICESHSLSELHRLDVVTAVMPIDNAFMRNDFIENNPVLIVAAVRSVHDKAPNSARPEVEGARCSGKSVRSPPLPQMF